MNRILVGIAILCFAMVSCNPIDETQLPPSNTSNLTPTQGYQLINGTWYLDRVEVISGPTCGGGSNEIRNMFTTDLSYSGWRIQFTQNSVSSILWPAYQCFTNGGNSTVSYSIVPGTDESLGAIFAGFQPNDGIFLYVSGGIVFFEDYMLAGGGKIEFLSENELRINGDNGNYNYGMLYLKRSNVNSTPLNSSNLLGQFVHDNTKVVQSGVVVSNTLQQNGHTLVFTNEITSLPQSKRLYYNCQEITSGISNPVSPDFLGNSVTTTQSYFCTSESHLIGPQTSATQLPDFSYKIATINNSELVLRKHINCNDYTEYHLTKVN